MTSLNHLFKVSLAARDFVSKCCPLPHPLGQGLGDEEDLGEEASNAELVSLLSEESGDHPVFRSYRESFEDQYGDVHDWSGGVTTQLYLCRQLYIHYTIQVW